MIARFRGGEELLTTEPLIREAGGADLVDFGAGGDTELQSESLELWALCCVSIAISTYRETQRVRVDRKVPLLNRL